MFTSHPRPHRARAQQIVTLLVATCVTLLAIGAAAAARATSQPTATISTALHSAIAWRTADRRALAQDSSTLSVCRRAHARRCTAERHAVKHLRVRLAAAERRVRDLSVRIAGRRSTSTSTQTSKGKHAPISSTPIPPAESSSGTESGSGAGGSTTTEGTGSISGSAGSTGTPGAFEAGIVAGSALTYELPFVQKLGAHTARMEFDVNTSTSQMASIIEAYARAGVRPMLLASFNGTLPSSAEAQNLENWAAAFGPGGTLWQGKSFPAGTAVTDIEFGNETSYAYQFSDTSKTSNWYALSSYASRAQTYALRFKEAQTAIASANPSVGLLAQADDGGSGSSAWIENMFAAVPDLAQRVAGWTIHPYGPKWQARIDKLVSSTAARGAPSTIPIYVTEIGLSSDNGRCLSDNYGWNPCMTYSEAASTLDSTVSAMRARYGSRLAALYVYQGHDQATTGSSTERESYFGALQNNSSTKGTYTTEVESLLSTNP
jgi:hypothetical protein